MPPRPADRGRRSSDAALCGVGAGDVAAGEVGLCGDEQALRQLEVPLRGLRLDDGVVRRLDGLVEQVGLQQRAGDRAAPLRANGPS